MTDKQWFIAKYDAFVLASPDEKEVEKSRDAVAHAYADAVEKNPKMRRKRNLIEEGRMIFDREVGGERDRRRRSLRRDVEYIADALAGNTVLGPGDPLLDRAYPLGTGADKSLRYWTPADWIGAIRERDELVEDAKRAAREFSEHATSVVTAMVRRGVTMTGGLFRAADDDNDGEGDDA